MEIIVCDICGRQYNDEPSIRLAKEGAENWGELCQKDNVEPRGIAPCPLMTCKGEMLLKVV